MPDDQQIEEFFHSPLRRPSKKSSFSGKVARGWRKLKPNWPSREQWLFLPRVLSSRERRLILILALAIVILLTIWPLGLFYQKTTPVPDFGGSYTEGLLGEPKYINPLLSLANDTDRDLAAIIYSALLKYDPQGQLVPDLAESYEISSDGLEYLFTLKKNTYWHDGLPLSSDDVVFTIRLLQNNDYGSSQRINWQGVEVEKVNEWTVKIKLRARYAQFLNNATLGILPKHLWENVKPANFALSDLNLKPVGSGPYKFKRLKKNEQGTMVSYELEAFEQYSPAPPFIKKIDFRFFSSEEELIAAYNRNEIEGLGYISPQRLGDLKFPQRLKTQEIKLPRYFAAFFNQNQSAILADKNVRLALNYGTDKETLRQEVLRGYGLITSSPLLEELWADTPTADKFIFDPFFARQILENSQWKDDDRDGYREKSGTPLEIRIKTLNWPELLEITERLEQQWTALGFKITRQAENLSEIQQSIKERAYEVLVFGEVLNLDPDPYSFWHSSQKKDPGLNLTLYDNKNADKMLEESRQLLSPLERQQKYRDFAKILLEDAPAVFLYSPFYLYLVDRGVKGNELTILPTPSSRFNDISQWYIKTKREQVRL